MLESFSKSSKLDQNMKDNDIFKQFKICYTALKLNLFNVEFIVEETCKYNKRLKYNKQDLWSLSHLIRCSLHFSLYFVTSSRKYDK
jgi:hypothetical protein